MEKESKIINALKKALSIGQITQVPVDVTDKSYRSISDKEIKNIMKSVYVADATSRPIVDKLQIPSMLDPISKDLIDRRVDNEKLTAIAPEIDQAASILIPSILSPNDFSTNNFDVTISGGNESEDIKAEIVELITDHFNEELDFSVRLSKWVHDAMFRAGSKAIMIIPTTIIEEMKSAIGTVEGVSTISNHFLKEIERSTKSVSVKDASTKDVSEVADKIVGSGALEYLFADSDLNGSREYETKRIKKQLKTGIPNAFKSLCDTSKIKFTDDPRFLLKSKFNNSVALESINRAILDKLGADPTPFLLDRKDGIADPSKLQVAAYKYMPYLDLSEFIHDGDMSAYPAMIELPTEAVIPIIAEGSPSNHIGYFIVLNENGSPVSIESDNFGDLMNSTDGTQRINNLYSAFYGTATLSVQKKMAMDAKVEILNNIYDSFLRNMMSSKLDEYGLDKYYVNLTNNVSRVMMTRLLKSAETRVLFVPKKLMMYLAFEYNSDGTGKSKIDNIKFPLSLKMTLIVTRLISLIESSINRKTLNITLDDGIGNPLEILRTIKKEIVGNKMYGLSYDPSTIIKDIIDKQLTIVPNKIPGVEDFSISETTNNVEYPKPDDAILDEINNMYTLSLGVPPSAMNRLSEDEFSRSVASNNIFFSNQLKTYQRTVCMFMTELITTYIGFSKKLKDSITDILKSETNVSGTTEDARLTDDELRIALEASKETKEKKISINTRLINIIGNIRYNLPAPNLAQDKSAFEEIHDYIEIIDAILMALFPDEMAIDENAVSAIKVIRSTIKRSILQEHISTNSMFSTIDFNALKDVDLTSSVETTQKLLNLKAALDNAVKVFSGEETESTPSW